MRSDINDLKQKLELGEVSRYCWVQDEKMLADISTKEKKEKCGQDDLLKENKLNILRTEDNCVRFVEGEIEITGRKLQQNLIPKKKIPMRKKIGKVEKESVQEIKKEEEEESQGNVTLTLNPKDI